MTATTKLTAEPARSLHIALQEAERIHIELTAKAEELIDRQDAGEQGLDDELYAANDAADRAGRDHAAIQKAFLEVARYDGPSYGNV